jgi:hypothetical protein
MKPETSNPQTTKYSPEACISYLKGKIEDLRPNDDSNGVAKSIEVYTDTIKHLEDLCQRQ